MFITALMKEKFKAFCFQEKQEDEIISFSNFNFRCISNLDCKKLFFIDEDQQNLGCFFFFTINFGTRPITP